MQGFTVLECKIYYVNQIWVSQFVEYTTNFNDMRIKLHYNIPFVYQSHTKEISWR